MLGTQYDLIARDAISSTPPRARCDSSSIFKKDLCLPTAFGCHWMERRLRCVAVLRSSQTSNPLDRQKERYFGSGQLSTVRTRLELQTVV